MDTSNTLHITVSLRGTVQLGDGPAQTFDRDIALSLAVQDHSGHIGYANGLPLRDDTVEALKGFLATTVQDAIDRA